MRRIAAVLSCLLLTGVSPSLASPDQPTNAFELTLDQYLQMVAQRNETVQMQVLAVQAARQLHSAEKGAFEPEVFAGASHDALDRQNTVQEETSQSGASTFSEDNNIYEGGLENLLPTGARIRLGYSLRDINNSLQDQPSFFSRGATNGEYQSFLGFSVAQPLLKNAGINANLARIRIAALSSKIAFQEYRKQCMLVLSTAESTYWQLYLLQEHLRFLEQSVKTAQTVLQDSQVRLDAGRGSELDVLEARAGLAARQTLLVRTQQKLRETSNDMASLAAERLGALGWRIIALTAPEIVPETPKLSELWFVAFANNADYLMQLEKAARDGIALGYSRNQRLPELNLRGKYGYSGLSDTPDGSWDEITSGDWPAWSIGIEFRMPVTGGTRARSELEAARLREQESLMGLRAMETQLLNGLDSAVQRIDETRVNTMNLETQVELNQRVLDTALTRLEVGQIESRKVLEIEAQLLEAKSAQVEALANHRKSVVQLHFLEGSLLKRHHLDFTQRDLAAASEGFIISSGINRDRFAEFIRTSQQAQAASGGAPWPGENRDLERIRSTVKPKLRSLDAEPDGYMKPEHLSNPWDDQ